PEESDVHGPGCAGAFGVGVHTLVQPVQPDVLLNRHLRSGHPLEFLVFGADLGGVAHGASKVRNGARLAGVSGISYTRTRPRLIAGVSGREHPAHTSNARHTLARTGPSPGPLSGRSSHPTARASAGMRGLLV